MTITIIVLLSTILYYHNIYPRYQIDDWYSIINEEKAKLIADSFLNNNSLTQFQIINVTDKYRGRVVDSQVNLYDQHNNSRGWVLVKGDTAEISSININEIEIRGSNYIKITPNLWQKISASNKSSYCNCILNTIQPLSEDEKKILVEDQKFEIAFENKTTIIGVVSIDEINNIININKFINISCIE